MSFKRWKLGCLVAAVTGLFTTFIVNGTVDKATNKELVFLTLAFIGKDLLLYLQQNPVDKISFDTITVTKQQTEQTTTTLSDSTAKETKP